MTEPTTPTEGRPRHHISLTDGTTTLGFALCGPDGKVIQAINGRYPIQRAPLMRTALKTAQGQNKYEDYEWPYMSIAQDDWSGGRGSERFDDDTARYMDSYRVDTTHEGKLMLGPLDHYGTGIVTNDSFLPEDVSWMNMDSSPLYMAHSFVASASYDVRKVYVWFRKVGSPGNLNIALYSENGGYPYNILKREEISGSSYEEGIPYFRAFDMNDIVSLVYGWTYWVVAFVRDGTHDTYNYWQIGVYTSEHGGTTYGASSTDGNTWTLLVPEQEKQAIIYRLPNALEAKIRGLSFVYKNAFYVVTQPDDKTSSKLYINGDRGVARAQTNLNFLRDTTKSWSTNQWLGATVLITAGPGTGEYSTVTWNDSDSIAVSPAFKTVHSNKTEYVILGSDKWTLVTTFTDTWCTDVTVAGNNIYFAFGDQREQYPNPVVCIRYYNKAGVWTPGGQGENIAASKVLAIRHPDEGFKLYGALHDFVNAEMKPGKTMIWEASAPQLDYGRDTLYTDLGELAQTVAPWDCREIDGVSHGQSDGHTRVSVDSEFETGVIAVENLDEAVDITIGDNLAVKVKSSIDLSSGDLQFVMDDLDDLGRYRHTPMAVKWWNIHRGDPDPMAPTITDIDIVKDTETHFTWGYFAGNIDDPPAIGYRWLNDRYLLVCHSEPFNSLYVTIESGNSELSILNVKYTANGEWLNLSPTDGTSTDIVVPENGATMNRTGDITWPIPYGWEPITIDGVTGYWVRVGVSDDLTDGIKITEFRVRRQNNKTYDFPALVEDQWTWVELDITQPTKYPAPDETRIKSVGLKIAKVYGLGRSFNIQMDGGVRVTRDGVTTFTYLPDDEHINKLIAYSGNTADPRTNPWAITTKRVYEMQTQNNNVLVPLPIGEIEAFSSPKNGEVACVNDVYLWFNLGDKMERYYAQNLDDVGPDREYLPFDRRATPSDIVSYPGRIYAAYSGSGKFSTIMTYSGNSWCEIYRSPAVDLTISGLLVQPVPGNVTRLWFVEGSDLKYIHLSPQPEIDDDYDFIHMGYLDTGWIYAGMDVVRKVFKQVTLLADDMLYYTPIRSVQVAYKVNDDTNWTLVKDANGALQSITTAFEELELDSPPPSGRRIQIRLYLMTEDGNISPVIKTNVLDTYGIAPVKYGYSFQAILSDAWDSRDVDGREYQALGSFKRVEDAVAQLDTWVNSGTLLTMGSAWSPFDGKSVILDPSGMQPIYLDPKRQVEQHIIQIVCNEI